MKPSKVILTVALLGLAPLAMAAPKTKVDTPAATATPPDLKNWTPSAPTVFPGGTQLLVGALANTDPTFNRTQQGTPPPGGQGGACGTLSGVGSAVFFDTFSVTNSTASTVNVNLRMTNPTGGLATFDTFLHVYSPSFTPGSATTNCIKAGDDGPGGIGESEISGASAAPIPAGAVMVVVADSFSNASTGSYGICITDQASVCSPPTPVELMSFEVK